MHAKRYEQAAIEAELAGGAREPSDEAAKGHVIVRIARVILGFSVLIAGIAMLPLPGPGGLVIAAGLVILAVDIAWADRTLRIVRRRMPGVPEDGKIPRHQARGGAVDHRRSGLQPVAGSALTKRDSGAPEISWGPARIELGQEVGTPFFFIAFADLGRTSVQACESA